MNKPILIFLVFFTFFQAYTQEAKDSLFIDSNYLEDQIYLGVTYNVLRKQPANFNQNGLSGGLSIGFIKDIPLNEERNIGFGIGLGYAYNAYIQNLKISAMSNITQFEVLESSNFKSNRFSTHLIEVPLEFRWRTSTASKYNFWRVYSGVKFGYLFASSSKISEETNVIKLNNISEFQKLQYGLTLNAGYNTFNLSLYYGLNPLFKDAKIESEQIDLKQFNIGLMFYIL